MTVRGGSATSNPVLRARAARGRARAILLPGAVQVALEGVALVLRGATEMEDRGPAERSMRRLAEGQAPERQEAPARHLSEAAAWSTGGRTRERAATRALPLGTGRRPAAQELRAALQAKGQGEGEPQAVQLRRVDPMPA